MHSEVYVDIVGFEGIYQVSNIGNVKKICGYNNGQILKQGKTKDGYKCVNLSKKGKTKGCFVHRLVAMHFVPNPLNKPCVNHLNRIRDDNRVENLEWVTQSENVLYSIKCGYRISDVTRKRMSDAHKGYVFSESHRMNLSLGQQGEKSHRSIPIVDTITGSKYVSIKDYARKNGLNYHTTKGRWRQNKLSHLKQTVQ